VKVCKATVLLALIDFIICLIAFTVQLIYADNEIIYFKAVDYSWAIRVVLFSLFIIFVLSSEEDLSRLKQLNLLAAYLFLFQFGVYYVDLLKNILAYDNIFLWKELFYIKKVGHVGIIVWFNYRINKLSKDISYITN
jgi:hypothetical protein